MLRIINKNLLVRRITIVANDVEPEEKVLKKNQVEQLSLFTDTKAKQEKEEKRIEENNLQHAIIDIKKKYGKNGIVKCIPSGKFPTLFKISSIK